MLDDNFIKKLLTSIKCSVCGHYFMADRIDVLAQAKGLWFLKASCPSCNTKCLVAAVEDDVAASAVTDLAQSEMKRFDGVDAVNSDDVLTMHDFLKEFGGDFSRLFEQRGLKPKE